MQRDWIHATYLSTSSIQNFSLAIVDLLMGHCDLALVRHLGVPAVLGYWSHQLVGGEALLTAASLPASHVPFVVGYTDEMSFFQRILNYAHRLAIRTEIWYATLTLGEIFVKVGPSHDLGHSQNLKPLLYFF